MVMDAKHYAQIADKIRQISLKIEKNTFCATPAGKQATLLLLSRLDDVLRSIDHVAWMDDRGML